MKFKILNAHRSNNNLLISGCYVAENGEKELLEELRQVLEEVNKTVNDGVLCDRFVSNDKTILIKSVPIETVYAVLQLQNNAFNLHMHIVMGRNMQNNRLRPEIEQFFTVHKF